MGAKRAVWARAPPILTHFVCRNIGWPLVMSHYPLSLPIPIWFTKELLQITSDSLTSDPCSLFEAWLQVQIT